MRKLYALLAGLIFVLVGNNSSAQTVIPDVAGFSFTVDAPNNNVAFNNTSTIGNLPGIRKAFWTFGDGTSQWTPPLGSTTHHYASSGNYQVCLRIYRYFNSNDSAITAYICKTVTIETVCRANFEKLPIAASANPLNATFKAIPFHNANKKPVRICWSFGDGTQTCINYTTSYTGQYTITHNYANAGFYEVCVNILYDAGCEAHKCENIRIGNPDSCSADFERLPVASTANPLQAVFKALPWHSNNNKPVRICWTFGDGRDTCINYTNTYTGPYTVSHTYLHPGQYEVCVKITYAGGCESTKCKLVIITAPDQCSADFERIPGSTANPLLVYFKAITGHNNNRKPSKICWTFGDGRDTCINYPENYTGLYGVSHHYDHAGQYEVCVKIFYYGGCEAQKCKLVIVTVPDQCTADFERIPGSTANPLLVYFKAITGHNNNRKPSKICWTFGDGRDTCINYSENYTGVYAVSHHYDHAGQYEVCVKIFYYGGCEAQKCKLVIVTVPDQCTADFERIPGTNANPLLVYFKAIPGHNNNRKPSKVCWTFGDGRDTCINYAENYTGLYGVSHRYDHPGQYEVCVKIFYYGGCEAQKCKLVIVTVPDQCTADFERLPVAASANPLQAHFKAIPGHSNNRKPSKVCWTFGDGSDTCINYAETYAGVYGVGHLYDHPGLFEVCVKIFYYGGCEARKCRPIEIIRPDSCRADFERIPTTSSAPLVVGFRALPWHNNNKPPVRICWTFGDGSDTCINYPVNYQGPYTVTHHYDHPGQYEVCVKIFYYGGCESRKCREITIPPPQVNCSVQLFEITPSITSLTRGLLAIPHTDPYRRPERVCWIFGDGTDTCIILNPQQPVPLLLISHTYPGPGVYHPCVRIQFQGGCIAQDCREVVIRSVSNVCGGYMVDSLSGPRTFRFKGFSIHDPNDEVISWRWTFGDGSSALGREVTHTYNVAGNYEVCLYIVTRLGCETRICKTLHVPGMNSPALVLTPNPVQTVLHAAFLSTHTEQVTVKIVNGFGTIVRSYTRNVTIGPNNWDMIVTDLLPGVYTCIVQSPNQLASAIFIKL